MWLEEIRARNVRNLKDERVPLCASVNVFTGRNAQGKTSLLETVGLVARGRSFRTEHTQQAIGRGGDGLLAGARAVFGEAGHSELEFEVYGRARRLRVDGRPVTPRDYYGRVNVVVYSTERLRVVHGGMRLRRQFLDRGAAALWPSYRHLVRECERVSQQRNACLQNGSRGLGAWDERLLELGARLRARRGAYVDRLRALLDTSFMPAGEGCDVSLSHPGAEPEQRERLLQELRACRSLEQRAQRSLVGPQRDAVALTIDGRDAAAGASSGQVRSLLLALVLATLELQREEHGRSGVALLDDLDSELDEERSERFCRRVSQQAQTLITTAHPSRARSLAHGGQLFDVSDGHIREAA